MIQWHLLSDQNKSIILRKLPEPAKTQSNTGGIVSIEKTDEVYDYQDNSDGKNVNGVDTTTTYKYIKNVDCTSKKTNSASAITLDHSNGRKLTLSG